MGDYQIDRRGMFQSLLAIFAAGSMAACGQEPATEETAIAEPPEPSAPPGFLTAEEMALVSAVAQTIIPKTETAGAVEAGVPETLQELATNWAHEGFRKFWRRELKVLAETLSVGSGTAFDQLSIEDRKIVLVAHDAKVFSGEVKDQFYKDLKRAVVDAYYMSEPGASEELAYEPVPGEWIGCVPLSEYPKTWAT